MYRDNGTFIGKNGSRSVSTPDNAKHIFVCGTTGSGKTVALANYIKRAMEQKFPLLLLDGKGDIGEGSMLDIVRRLNPPGRKLYIVNFTAPETSNLYNPFIGAAPTVAKDMLVNLTDWNEEYYKLNTERYLQRVIQLMTKSGLPLSLSTIVRHMSTGRFTELSAALVKKEVITKEDHIDNLEIAKTSGKVSENSIARFSLIAESELGHIFSVPIPTPCEPIADADQPALEADSKEESALNLPAPVTVDIYSALRERATILFILNPLIYPELSPMLGRLVLIDCKKAINKLFTADLGRTFFIFDEINVYASSALIDLVNKSRSANITCILATQSLSDLSSAEDDNFKEQIIENCNNYIILRQNSAKGSEDWANILGTRNTMEVTYQMEHRAGSTVDTGLGSARLVREFIYHPDDIKSLRPGQAFYLSRDTGQHCKVKIFKAF